MLAGLATASGFLSFLPTAYRGVSELGEIASSGMIIALIGKSHNLAGPASTRETAPESAPLGYAWLIPLDEFLERRRLFHCGWNGTGYSWSRSNPLLASIRLQCAASAKPQFGSGVRLISN